MATTSTTPSLDPISSDSSTIDFALEYQRLIQEQSIWQVILGDIYFTGSDPTEEKEEKPYREVDSFVELW